MDAPWTVCRLLTIRVRSHSLGVATGRCYISKRHTAVYQVKCSSVLRLDSYGPFHSRYREKKIENFETLGTGHCKLKIKYFELAIPHRLNRRNVHNKTESRKKYLSTVYSVHCIFCTQCDILHFLTWSKRREHDTWYEKAFTSVECIADDEATWPFEHYTWNCLNANQWSRVHIILDNHTKFQASSICSLVFANGVCYITLMKCFWYQT
jgi:hypothetical protein